MVDAPGILGALHAAEGGLELAGELAFDHDLVAANVDDVEHLLVLGGADLHAGSAGGAGPGGFGGESELEERVRAWCVFFEWGSGEDERVLLRGEVVELHALVDLERGGGEGFAGGGGGADILAAIALDAGVGVEEARPGEVFEFVGADGLCVGFCVDIDCDEGEDAGGGFAGDEVLRRGHEDVDVFGVGEVGEEGEDGAEGSPVAEDAEGFGVGGGEEVGEQSGEGLEVVGAFGGDLGSGSDGAAADVEEDEGGDDEGIAGDLLVLNVFVEECAWVEAEVDAAGEGEAADDQSEDAEEDEEAEDVGEEVVGCADEVGGADGEWEVAFGGVDKIDQAVEDEAVEDEGVEESDGGAFFEGALLGESGGEGVGDAAREMVEAGFGVRGAATDAEVEAIEAVEAQREGDDGEEEEGDLLRKWKHWAGTACVLVQVSS